MTAKKVEKGDLISVPLGNKFLKGIVKDVKDDHLILNNYSAGDVSVPITADFIKMFPGQKYDLRELDIKIPEDNNLSVKDKIDAFLSKTSIGKFENLDKSERLQLLSGKLTRNPIDGSSIIKNEDNSKSLKNWTAKFLLYKSDKGYLKLDVKFKRNKLDLNVYGKPITNEQKKEAVDNGKTLILDRAKKDGVKFKVFARFDKDLNRIISFPYNKKIAERIVKAQSKDQTQKTGTTQKTKENQNVANAKLDASSKAISKGKDKKQEGTKNTNEKTIKPKRKRGPKL